MLNVRYIPDPFSPDNRELFQLKVNPDELELSHYVPAEYRSGYRYHLASRGRVQFEDLETTRINPEHDELVITPDIQIDPATWAAIGAAVWAGLQAAGAWLAANWLTVLAGAISIGTSLFSMFGAKKPALSAGTDAVDSSPTYGWDGIQSTAAVDVPIPVIYGRNIVGGNFINAFVENRDETAYLNLLIALCEGPITQVAGIEEDTDDADVGDIGDQILIDGNPISNYDGVTVKVRMGTHNQSHIPGFGDIHNLQSLNVELKHGDSATQTTAAERDVDYAIVNLRANSLYRQSEGDFKATELSVKWEFREFGSGSWHDGGTWTVTKKRLAPFRASFRIDFPSSGRYDVRGTKLTADSSTELQTTVFWTGLDGVSDDKLIYPYTTLLGLRIKATAQLSGQLTNVKVSVHGRAVKTWNTTTEEWETKFSRNPVWCVLDMVEDKNVGVGKYIELAHITNNYDRWKAEAAYCDQQIVFDGEDEHDERYDLDVVIDADMTAYDLLNRIGASFSAIMLWTASSVTPIIDRPTAVTQFFSDGNVIRKSVDISYKSRRKMMNRVEIQFPDKSLAYERNTIEAVDQASIAAGDPERTNITFLMGIVRMKQAIMVATQILKTERLVTRTVSWESGVDGVYCQAGDVVEFATNLVKWGFVSGTVMSAGNAQSYDWVKINRRLIIETGQTFKIKVRKSDMTTEEMTIDMAPGNYAPGYELKILESWDGFPVVGNIFSVGEAGKVVKLLRLIMMQRKNNGHVAFTGVDYDENIFDTTGIIVLPSTVTSLNDPRRIPRGVSNLVAINAADQFAKIIISWENSADDEDAADDLVSHYEIYESLDGEVYTLSGVSNGGSYIKTPVVAGQKYWFKVIPVSRLGRKPNIATAPTVTIIASSSLLPSVVTGLELFGLGHASEYTGRDPKFTWKQTSVSTPTDLTGDINDAGAGAGTPDDYFQDYMVEIWVNNLKRRTEYVTANFYTYGYERNYEDNAPILGIAARQFTIKVYARDIFGQLSPAPAELEVNNPRPTRPLHVVVIPSFRSCIVRWDDSVDLDLEGYLVWAGDAVDFTPSDVNLVYRGRSNTTEIDVVVGTPRYIRVAAYDGFGEDTPDRTDPYVLNSTGVVNNEIVAAAVTTDKLDANSITANKISSNAIQTRHLNLSYNPSFQIFEQSAVPTSTHIGDIWFRVAPNPEGTFRAASVGADAITSGEWEPVTDLPTVINAQTTQIDPGRILIFGGTSLDDWRDPVYTTEIAGGHIATNSIDAYSIKAGVITTDKLVIGDALNVFSQMAIPTAVAKGDAWYKLDGSGVTTNLYIAAVAGANSIGTGQWEEVTNLARIINNGQTRIDGANIKTGSIEADKIAVNDLSALSADLGNITSGEIVLSVTGGSGLNKLRINDSGIYVSHDSGATWRAFLSIDSDGNLVVSFDSVGEDAVVQGVYTQSSDSADAFHVSEKLAETTGGVFGAWNREPVTSYDQAREIMLVDLEIKNNNNDVDAQIELGLYDTNSNTLVWSSAAPILDPTPTFTDGAYRFLVREFPILVNQFIAKGDPYEIAWRRKTSVGDADFKLSLTGYSFNVVELLNKTWTGVNPAGGWTTWEKTPLTAVGFAREYALMTSTVENLAGVNKTIDVELGIFDDTGAQVYSKVFANTIDAGDTEVVTIKVSRQVTLDLALGDAYKIGVRFNGNSVAGFNVDALLYKSRMIGLGSLVKE